MRSPFASLARLMAGSVFGFKGLSELRSGGAKAWLKAAGFVLLFILVLADMGLLFVMSNASTYQALAPLGLEELLLLNAATISAMIVLVLGLVTALSTYCLSPSEVSLIALPLDPRYLLGAKFLTVYLMELGFSVFLFATSLGVYGFYERPPILFYVYGLVSAVSAPLFPLALAYLLMVPLMSGARFLRNKNAVMIVAGVVGMAFALAFNLYIQAAMARLKDPAWILANFAGPEAILSKLGGAYPPSYLSWKALSLSGAGKGLAALPYALAGAALGLGSAAAVVLLLGKAYAASLLGFGEGRLKRVAAGQESSYIRGGFRSSSLLTALLRREWRLMNREPVYFLNGPLIVILMPAIMAAMYVVQRESFAELQGLAELLPGGAAPYLIAAAAGTFLGSATSIACTSLSRDAKALPYLKALPLPASALMAAKLLHGLVFSLVGAVVGGLGLSAVLGAPPLSALAAFFTALSFSALINLGGLWLDTAFPRLSWDSPTAAMKQNPNSVIVILGAMGLLGGLGFLSTKLGLGVGGFFALYGGGSAALFALLLPAYLRYAKRRLEGMEA